MSMTTTHQRLSNAVVHCLFSVLLLASMVGCILPAQAETKGAKPITLAEVEAKQIIALAGMACLLSLDGKVYCWTQDNRLDQASLPLQQVDLGNGGVAKNLYGRGLSYSSYGGNHGCAVLTNNAIRCWTSSPNPIIHFGFSFRDADNLFDLSASATESTSAGRPSYPVKPAIVKKLNPSAGLFVTGESLCGLTPDDKLYCPDPRLRYLNGKTGVSNVYTSEILSKTLSKTLISETIHCLHFRTGIVECFSGPEAVDTTRPARIAFGQETAVKLFEFAHDDVCAVTKNNNLVCGSLMKDAKGHLAVLKVESYDARTEILKTSATLPRPYPPPHTITAIHVVDGNTCLLLENGTVHCWGGNRDKQITGSDEKHIEYPGLPIDLGTTLKIKSMAIGPGYGCYLLENNRVRCRGRDDRGIIEMDPDHDDSAP